MQNKANLQDIFLLRARRDAIPVTMFLMNGFQMRGVITGYDAFVVILDSDHPGLPFSCVTMDNRDIAYQAMMHLISLGTRDIGYLRSTIRTGNFVSRENGYIEALRAEHIAPDPALIVQPYAQPDRRVPGYGRMPAGGAARAPGPVCGQRYSGHWRHAGAL